MKWISSVSYKLLVIICLLSGATVGLFADEVKDLQKQQSSLQKQLEQTTKLLNNTKSNEKATLNKLQLLDKDISVRKKLIANINTEIRVLDSQMEAVTRRQTTLQHQLDSIQTEYASSVRLSHRVRITLSPLLFVLSAQDFFQFFRRLRYLRQYSLYQRENIDKIKKIRSDLSTKNEILKEDRRVRKTRLQFRQKEQENLKRGEKKHQTMLAELKKQSKKLSAQQQKQQKQIETLNKKIETLIAKQVAATKKEVLSAAKQAVGKRFETNKGKLPSPVEKGIITGTYGLHKHPLYPDVTINNRGMFFQTASNGEARSVFEGEVTSCFMVNKVYAIIIQHGNYRTVYTGISKPYVKTKTQVKALQKIGKIYCDTDADNKTELQFQVWKDRDIQDPGLWLAKQ